MFYWKNWYHMVVMDDNQLEEQQEQDDEDIVDIGEPMAQWEVDEYPPHERTRTWYIIAVSIGVALIVYATITANFLFAVIILMVGVIMLVNSFKHPEKIPVVITTTGVLVDETYYDFDAVRDFSIVYDPPTIKTLYFDFHSPWHPLLSIPLEEVNPNDVRALLLPFCAENLERKEERLTDAARRMYKL